MSSIDLALCESTSSGVRFAAASIQSGNDGAGLTDSVVSLAAFSTVGLRDDGLFRGMMYAASSALGPWRSTSWP